MICYYVRLILMRLAERFISLLETYEDLNLNIGLID